MKYKVVASFDSSSVGFEKEVNALFDDGWMIAETQMPPPHTCSGTAASRYDRAAFCIVLCRPQ